VDKKGQKSRKGERHSTTSGTHLSKTTFLRNVLIFRVYLSLVDKKGQKSRKGERHSTTSGTHLSKTTFLRNVLIFIINAVMFI
jgi:hypothetical protein